MDDRILILGPGYIGSRLKEALNVEASNKIFSTFTEAEEEIKKYNPKIIINCIGYTGRNVDECELNKDNTLLTNTFIPIILAEVALRHNIKLVHISSGCIYHYDYSNDTPITEERAPDFFGLYYSRTKIYAEQALNILAKKYPSLIVRIRIPLDNRSHPKNILSKLIEYKKIIDVPNSVTYIPDFIEALKHLIKIDARGIFNVVNKNPLSYAALLDVYRKYAPDFKYEIIDHKKLNLVRTNLVLSTEKLENSGFKVRDIRDVLEECVRGYLEIKG